MADTKLYDILGVAKNATDSEIKKVTPLTKQTNRRLTHSTHGDLFVFHCSSSSVRQGALSPLHLLVEND